MGAQGLRSGIELGMKFRQMQQDREEFKLRKQLFELQKENLKYDIQTRQHELEKLKQQNKFEPQFYEHIRNMISKGEKPELLDTASLPPLASGSATQRAPGGISSPPSGATRDLSLGGPVRQPLFLGAEFANPMMQPDMLAPRQPQQTDMASLLNDSLNLRGPTRDLMFLNSDSTSKPVSSQSLVRAVQTPTPASSLMQYDNTIPASRKDLARALELADLSGNMDQLTFAFEHGIIDNPQFRAEQLERMLKAQKAEVDYQKANRELREYGFRTDIGTYWANHGEQAAAIEAFSGDWGKALQLHSEYGPMLRSMTDNDIMAAALKGDPKAIQLLELKIDLQKETGKTVTRVNPDGTVEIGVLDQELPVYPKKSLEEDLRRMRELQTGMKHINTVKGLIEADPKIVGAPGFLNKMISNLLVQVGDLIDPDKAKEIREKSFGKTATARSQMESLGELIAFSYATGSMGNPIPTNQDVELAKNSLGIDNNWYSIMTSPEALIKLESVMGTFQDTYKEIEGRKSFYEERAPKYTKPATSLQELLMRHNTPRGKVFKQQYGEGTSQQSTVTPAAKTSSAPETPTSTGIGEAAIDPVSKEGIRSIVQTLTKGNKQPTMPKSSDKGRDARYKRYLYLKAKQQGN